MSNNIPEGWGKCSIGDVARLQGGYAFKSIDSSESGIRWLKIANVGKGKIKWEDESYLPNYFQKEHSNFLLERGDSVVALTRPITQGELKVAQIRHSDLPALLNQRVARVLPKQHLVERDFIYALFRYEAIAQDIEITIFGTDPPNVSTKQIEDIQVLLPPLPEQKKIAAILTSVDEVIEKTQAQIDKLKDLKTGMMQELLTRGVGVDGKPHSEFKDSPVGRIPKSWEVVNVGSLVDVIDPQPDHRTPPEVENGIPYVGLGDIDKSGVINFSGARKVSQAAFDKQCKSFELHKGAFVFGKIGTIGSPSILPEQRFYCLSANVVLITGVNYEVLRYIFQVFTSGIINEQISQQTNTTSQPALGIKKVRDFLIPLPTLSEMKSLVGALTSIDQRLTVVKTKLDKLKSSKKALMQDLLTGKVRVEVED
ncbi:restriction endonuclease subunit S [Vibrio harveyi]|uniref:restriction endonuclease subunit S n=1 Tax=Vibrio harveyi TaxID=669 RepID=UPI00238053EE|nr:restriction endonuclease subunit S [Vibrio harveyi]